jgi:hypothetical protein
MSEPSASLPKDISRFLRSVYGQYRRHPNEGEAQRVAQDLKRQAFPALQAPVEFAFINSRRRSFRQTPRDAGGLVIADQGETALVALEDFLVRTPRAGLPQSLTLMQVPFAEAFRRNNSLERSLLCATQALDAAPLLAGLAREAFGQAGYSLVGLFLLLHEIAHFAIDTRQPFAESIRSVVAESLRQHCMTNLEVSERLLRGEGLPDVVESSVADEPPEASAVMARQMREHVAFASNNPEVIREASCDFLAVAGLLSWRTGVDVLEPKSADIGAVTPQEVGDIVMSGLRVSRLLVVNQFVEQTALHIARAADRSRLEPAFSQLTARQNVMTNLMLGLFDGILEKWQFRQSGESAASSDELSQHFRDGVEFLNRRSADLLFQAVETIGLFHQEPELVEADFSKLRKRFFGDRAPPQLEIKRALDAVLEKLPF